MAEDDQVHGRLPDELAERLGQAPLSNVRHPGSNRRKSLSPTASRANGVCNSRMRCHGGKGRLLIDLAPFMNLLPAEIICSEMKDQELLRTILLDVGRHTYAHLVKYLNAQSNPICLATSLNEFIPPPPNQLTTEQMVMLSECLDDAIDSIRDIVNHPGFKKTSILNAATRETIPEEVRERVSLEDIDPEKAATALTLLTASAFRRPPTRMVESMMAASQEAQTNGNDGDSQREDTETAEDTVPPPPASDDSLLGLACSTGLWELAALMARLRGSCDFVGESECTPLMEACAAGHEKIVRELIPYSADLNTQSVTQNTALIYASAAGHLDCVEVLLEAGKTRGIDLDVKNENGHCALMEAASGGHLEIVKKLIEAGSGSLRMNVNSEFKESPLTLAAYKGHRELVEYLLTQDLGETKEEELHTALMEASMDGHVEVAGSLLKAGAPVNLPSDSFESPLTLAACGGHTELVKMLLDAGASIEEPNDESYTPIMEAAREGHSDVVRMLIDGGAVVNAMTEETGETAMTLAACGGFTDIVEMLLEAGGDLEQGANTPLMEAATEGHTATAAGIIRMMKAHKQDKDVAKLPTIIEHVSTALVQAADNGHFQICRDIGTSGFVDLNFQLENRTALMKAAKGGFRDIIKFLVEAGADVNARSATADVTALSLACAGGHYDSVEELLKNHADPNVILKDGVTCVLEAARHGYVHIVELLLDYRGGAGGANAGPKPNRKVATPRRTAMRKAAPGASPPTAAAPTAAPANSPTAALAGAPAVPAAVTAATAAAATATAPAKAAKAQLAAAELALTGKLPPGIDATTAAMVGKPFGGAPVATPTKKAATAVAIATVAATSTSPGSAAPFKAAAAAEAAKAKALSEEMRTMAYQLPMPTKDQTVSPGQLDSFHKFHNFLVRTAKGENPPPPQIPAGMPAAEMAAAVVEATRNGAQICMEGGDSLRFTIKAAAGTAFAAEALDPAGWTNDTGPAATNTIPMGSGMIRVTPMAPVTSAQIFGDTDSSLSPSPCPSSPSNQQPLMTASSDEFVSEQHVPVQPKRRSASVPHDRSNPRWPSDSMLRQHEECVAKKKAAADAAARENAPPPAKRATGAKYVRQGTRPGTVEKRPLAATSTFDVDMQTESNNDTPLTLACSNGHTAMVELLVQRGANVHHRDKKGFTPLILAATGGHLKIVELLLDHGANIETTSERTKDTALSLACSGGKKEVAEMLLKRGANKEHRNVSDYTPLSLAASGGYVDICNMLLDAGAEINSRTGSKLGISPLMLAAMNGHKDATRVLLERGSDINAQIETNRNTALTLACFQGRTEVVRLLLQYNANVEHRAKTGLTPLMEAANGGYCEVGQLLMDNFADPNTSPVPSSRDTALTIAADKGHDKFVDLLLKSQAAVDARNKKGCTALWLACHGGHLETVQTLVKHKKINLELEDNRKVSPLMVAFRKGHTKIVKYLVKHVAQFPGDAELCRYIQTVTEQDLMTRCHECMNVIVTAKDKQAAQANLAADALIAQIEAEEEQARSKKLSKQKQKEKKKAKKQEKKKEEEVKKEDSDKEEEEPVVVEPPKEMPKEEPKKADGKKGKAAAASTPLAAAAAAKGKARAAAAAAAAAVAARPAAAPAPAVETTPERAVETAEDRIPGLNLAPAAASSTSAAPVAEEPASSSRKSTAADRRANRRNRNESGKNPATTATPAQAPAAPTPAVTQATPASAPSTAAPVTPAPAPAAPAPVPPVLTSPTLAQTVRSPTLAQQQAQAYAYEQYQKAAGLSPLGSPRQATQEEWVKANKKGRNARDKATGADPSARSTSVTAKLTDPTEEKDIAMWNNIEASRRRMATLTVSSPCIARVIGRGGANINAIREATGASIEVERVDKALSRRDNIDREICIRGTAETVKNAVAMINGLIAETDVTVNEIIRLVRNSASPSDQPRIDAYSTSSSTKMAAATAGRATAAAATAPATTNIWQQRMAARQAQDAAARPATTGTTAAAPAAAAAANSSAMAAAAAAVQLPPQQTQQPPQPAPHSPAPTTTSTASSPAITRSSTPPRPAEEPPKQQEQEPEQPVVEETPAPPVVSSPLPQAVPAAVTSPPSLLTDEDHAQLHEMQQRKAPGFARPVAAVVAPAPVPSVPSSPESPIRPSALPTTPLHEPRVPELAQHVMSFGDQETPEEQRSSTLTKQDSGSALFNDNTYKSIAEIWGDAGGAGDMNSSNLSSSNAFGGAWDNALLLNSFNNISLSKTDWGDFSTSSSSVLDSSAREFTPSGGHSSSVLGGIGSHSSSMPPSSNSSGYGMTTTDPFATNGPRSGPLFARGANAARAAAAAPAQQPKPQPQQQQQQNSLGNPLDSIFNNVAAALLHHQTGVTTTSSPMPSTTSAAQAAAAAQQAASNYYPSPSYTDPASMGLGSGGGLKAYGNGGVSAYLQQAAFARMQQQSTQQQQQQAAAAAAQAASQAAAMQARMAGANGYPPAPPPGFNQITPVPPPALSARSAAAASYFNSQMAPPPGTTTGAATSPFHLYAQNGWSNGLPQKQPAPAPPTMNGTSNGRGGASSFYSNGWN